MGLGPLLILSATEFETAPLRDLLVGEERPPHPTRESDHEQHWPGRSYGTLDGVPVVFAVSGLGKANAAAAVAASASGRGENRLAGVLQVGIGGAYPGSGLAAGTAVVAHSEYDLDLGVGSHPNWSGLSGMGMAAHSSHTDDPNRLPGARLLVNAVCEACGLKSAAFATSDSVTDDAAIAGLLASRHRVAVESMEGFAAAQIGAALELPFLEIRGVSNVVAARDKSTWLIPAAVAAACEAARCALKVMWEHVTSTELEAR